jgi:predicted ABC-type transport system involved in lysophospholipase L1 biosynthesis ATPase subunit
VADCFLDLQKTEDVTLVTVTHDTTLAARFDQRAYLKEGALRPENLE